MTLDLFTPKEEAEIILKEMLDDFGSLRRKDGPRITVNKNNVLPYMKEKKWSYNEMDWPAYYVKYRTIELCSEIYPKNFSKFSLDSMNAKRLQMLKGNYLWDICFSPIKQDSDPDDLSIYPKEIVLNDVNIINKILQIDEGLGVIVVDAFCEFDEDDSLKEWQDGFRGIESEYDKEIALDEDRLFIIRKKSFTIKRVFAFYFPKKVFSEGINEGWLTDNWLEDYRQPDNIKRKDKYLFYFDKVPNEYKLLVMNFNHDREDFANEHIYQLVGEF